MNYKKNYNKGGSLYSLLAMGGKPDYLDLDKDGNKEELMREAAKQMASGGRVYKFGGEVPKYEQGGPVAGSVQSGQKFRVIPEKSPTGQTELGYYIDGRPVNSEGFLEQFYAQGYKPEDLNNLIENTMKASAQGIGAESGIASGSPMERSMKEYRDALKERNVYRAQGASGIDSLYNARNENFERMMLQKGG